MSTVGTDMPFAEAGRPPLDGLVDQCCWLPWRLENHKKIAYRCDTLRRGWQDPAGWATRGEALAAARRLLTGGAEGGIGIALDYALAPGETLCGLDLDTCRNAEGEFTAWATTELRAFASYAEISPSGTGAKVFGRVRAADLPELLQALGQNEGVAERRGRVWKRGTEAHSPGMELYLGGRWFAVTGEHIPTTPKTLEIVPKAVILGLIRKRGPAFKGEEPRKIRGVGRDSGGGGGGGRSERVMGVAARMKANGASQADFEEWIDGDDEASSWRGDHDQRQVDRAWARAGLGASVSDLDGFDLTEDGVALAFAARHRSQLRFDHTAGSWYQWRGTYWQHEGTRLASDWCRTLCRDLRQQLDDEMRSLASRRMADAVEKFAQADRAFAVKADIWDRDPWLLGTPGGTVNLRTGELFEARPDDFISKVTAVAPLDLRYFDEELACPRWMQFLRDATGNDKELMRFLQQYAGYSLTGLVHEHVLIFIYGPGGNGKSVYQGTIAWLFGDYARAVPMETFAASKFDRHPTELALMKGARLCYASETEEGRAWAENRLKYLTGGDRLTARYMHRDFFEFDPTHKLQFIGNNRPRLRNVEAAERRRMAMVPFLNVPQVVNEALPEELRAEGPAILAWAIEGCLDWQRHRLVMPASVRKATDDYFDQQDTFGQWLATRCKIDKRASATATELYQSYTAHAKAQGEEEESQVRFAEKLGKRGFVKRKSDGVNVYKGLTLDEGHDDL